MNTKCDFTTGSGWHCIMDAHPETPGRHYMRYEIMVVVNPETPPPSWIGTAAAYAIWIGAMTMLTIAALAWFGVAS